MLFQRKNRLKNAAKESGKPTDRCLFCNQSKNESQSFLVEFFDDDLLCLKCRNSLRKYGKVLNVHGLKVYGLYEYNDFFSSLIIQYKECSDELLSRVFLYSYKRRLKWKYRNCLFIPAPSSQNKLDERGFYHVEKMLEELDIPIMNCFIKKENVKQSMMNKEEREKIQNAIELIEIPDTQRKIILVDDVMTTGNTLLAMNEKLKNKGIAAEALVFAIHPLLKKTGSDRIRQGWKHILKKK